MQNAQVLEFPSKPKPKSKQQNKIKFRDMFIKNIPFSQVRRDIWDSVPPLAGVPGVLGVRVGAKSKSFFILYRNSLGKQKRYTLLAMSKRKMELTGTGEGGPPRDRFARAGVI